MATGVNVTVAAQGTTAVGSTADSGRYFIVVQAERGPTANPTGTAGISSYGEVERIFGPAVPYSWLHNEARSYFEESNGAGNLVVLRVVGTNATTGFVSLNDRGSSGGAATLRLTASSPGAWSSDVSATVNDGLITGTVDLHILLDGNEVEEFLNLPTMTALLQAVNGTSGSEYVVASDLGSPASTDALKLPAVTTSPVSLNAGNDDRDTITAATYTAGLSKFTEDYGPGFVAIPGQPYSTVAAALASHCASLSITGREAAVCTPPNYSVAQTQTAARSLRSLPNSERLIMPFPWLAVPDGAGGSINVPPSGGVAGLRARQCSITGPWDAPAGDAGLFRYIIGTERDTPLTRAEVNALTVDAVSPVKESTGTLGPRLYGYRSLSGNVTQWKFLKYAATLDLISWQLTGALEQYVQRSVDGRGHLLQSMETTCEAVLRPIAEAGGLYARTQGATIIDPGYRIRIDDPEINPLSRLEQGEVDVYVGVRLSPGVEFIQVTLAKVTLSTAL